MQFWEEFWIYFTRSWKEKKLSAFTYFIIHFFIYTTMSAWSASQNIHNLHDCDEVLKWRCIHEASYLENTIWYRMMTKDHVISHVTRGHDNCRRKKKGDVLITKNTTTGAFRLFQLTGDVQMLVQPWDSLLTTDLLISMSLLCFLVIELSSSLIHLEVFLSLKYPQLGEVPYRRQSQGEVQVLLNWTGLDDIVQGG